MTLKNFTEAENQKTIVVLSCSAEFTAEVQGELIFLSIVNIFLSIAAVLGNTLILVALHKETSLHPPSKLLYRNLAVTDFCVGTIAEPLHVSYWISVVTGKWDICYLAHLMVTLAAYTFCGVSLLTLTAISRSRDFSLTRESKGRYTRGVLLPKFAQFAPGACSQILNRLNIGSILRVGNSAPEDEIVGTHGRALLPGSAPGACSGSKIPRVYRSLIPCRITDA